MKVVSDLNRIQFFCLWRNNQQQWAHNTEICCAATSCWMQKTTRSSPLRSCSWCNLLLQRRLDHNSCESCKPPNSEKKLGTLRITMRYILPWPCHGVMVTLPKEFQDHNISGYAAECKLCNVQLKWQIGICFEPVWKKNWWQFHPQQVQNPNLPDLAQESKLKATVEAAIATRAMDFFAGLKKAAISFSLDVTLHACLGLGARCAMQHCPLQCCKVSSRQLSHRQCQTWADVLKQAMSSTSKQEYCALHYHRCDPTEGHSEWATGATECLNRRHQQWLPVRDAAPEKLNNKMSSQLCYAAGCRSQKLLQDWSSFVPGKALDVAKLVFDRHGIKMCIANKECGNKTLVTLPDSTLLVLVQGSEDKCVRSTGATPR